MILYTYKKVFKEVIKMPKRSAKAIWEGNLSSGTGRISLESGLFKGAYTFGSRFKSKAGTNPEELIAGAHASCFSMALSAEAVSIAS